MPDSYMRASYENVWGILFPTFEFHETNVHIVQGMLDIQSNSFSVLLKRIVQQFHYD